MAIGQPPPSPRRSDHLFTRLVDERAIGLVEPLVVCAAELACILTSSIAATSVSSDRTKAEQLAEGQRGSTTTWRSSSTITGFLHDVAPGESTRSPSTSVTAPHSSYGTAAGSHGTIDDTCTTAFFREVKP